MPTTQVAAGPTAPVIVVLRDQPQGAPSITLAQRRTTDSRLEAPILGLLHATHARHIAAYGLVDAVSATVTTDQAAELETDPAVAAVVPDELVREQAGVPPQATGPTTGVPATTNPVPAGACPPPGRPGYLGQELPLIHAASDTPGAPTAQRLGFDGAGVKVGFLAEGIDVDNPDFIRAGGGHVITDYRDFSGDGSGAPTSGGEAFLDASAIAAQGKGYDLQNFGEVPLAAQCRIRIQGVAPGASLVALKVFAQNGYSTTSAILQAIDYAVNVDHVNVLNESLGYNPFPTTATQDVVELFNDAAVAAGTTVTVAAGDAGPNDTIGSPDTDPRVINVGASTAFRFYAETGSDGFAPPVSPTGWLDDGISGLSSGGFAQPGQTDDLVAPGDLSVAACTPKPHLYTDCTNLALRPSPIEFSGGTSESSPLTAGTAALVIQAYRSTHGGASPSPALVKKILVSTADDIAAPATEQGSGLLDAYRAVLAARSVPGSGVHGTGGQLLLSTGQLHSTADAGTTASWPLTVTNTGSNPAQVTLTTRTLSKAVDTQTATVTLADKGPRFFDNLSNTEDNFRTVPIKVAPGRARLAVDISYAGNPAAPPTSAVDVVLLDPSGRFAADADPQGVANAALAEARQPTPGTWTALVFSPVSRSHGTLGTVHLRAQTFEWRQMGTVTPSSVAVPAGGSSTVTVRATAPPTAGDQAGAVLATTAAGQVSSAVVTLRSLVPLTTGIGHFTGTLIGGNGRQPDLGQTAYFQWQVPSGETGRTLTADVKLAGRATDGMLAYLVDSQGQTVSFAANDVATTLGSRPSLAATSAVEVAAAAPAAGLWTLILNFAPALTGTAVATPFSGTVRLMAPPVHGAVLGGALFPDRVEAASSPKVKVVIHNTSEGPEDYFIDPRLTTSASMTLAPQTGADLLLPLGAGAKSPSWLVPADTTAVSLSASAPRPVTFDWGPGTGDPDLGATRSGLTASETFARTPVTPGLWFADPSLVGPYGSTAPARVRSQLVATVRTAEFDRTVTSPPGDLWLRAVTPASPVGVLQVAAGGSATVTLTVTPTEPAGTVVTGVLFVDELAEVPSSTANALNFQPGETDFASGSQVAALPYRYTVG